MLSSLKMYTRLSSIQDGGGTVSHRSEVGVHKEMNVEMSRGKWERHAAPRWAQGDSLEDEQTSGRAESVDHELSSRLKPQVDGWWCHVRGTEMPMSRRRTLHSRWGFRW